MNERGMKMAIEKVLYEAAIALAEKRYPSEWGGAAALYMSISIIQKRHYKICNVFFCFVNKAQHHDLYLLHLEALDCHQYCQVA